MKNIITKTKNKENQRVIVKIKLPEFLEIRHPAAKYKSMRKGNWNYFKQIQATDFILISCFYWKMNRGNKIHSVKNLTKKYNFRFKKNIRWINVC